MVIQNSAVNVTYQRVENIKSEYLLNADILRDRFNEATILPIPDDAPLEIPRILATTKQEHSQLNIAPKSLSFLTQYTDDYVSEWNLCEKYINTRVGDIFSLTSSFTGGVYNYIGVVTNLIWDDVDTDAHDFLYKNLFKCDRRDNLDDLEVKYTYIEEEKYYVNITLRSARVFDNLNLDEAGIYEDDKLIKHTISITVDVNDRYSYNRTKGYTSSRDRFDEIMRIVSTIINDKVRRLVECGEY